MIRFLFVVFMMITSIASAANHYINRDSICGTGSGCGGDWSNAYTDFPTTFVRGDIYYVAGNISGNPYGSGGITLNTICSGCTSYVTFKKATILDHGINTGWSDSYGTNQAFLTVTGKRILDITTSYWQFLGVQGTGKSGMGFVFTNTDHVASDLISLGNGDHFIFDHIEAYNFAYLGNQDTIHNDVIYGPTSGGNLTITNSYIHDNTWSALVLLGNNSGNPAPDSDVIDHNYFENAYNKEVCSCRNMTNFTFSNNIVKNSSGTAFVNLDGGHHVYIYNNLFYIYDGANYNMSTSWIGDFTTLCTACSAIHDVSIYGNTFFIGAGVTNQFDGIQFHNNGGNNVAENNIFYNPTTNILMSGLVTHDYNVCYPSAKCTAVSGETHGQIMSSDPFVASGADNFQLSAPTNSGVTLSAPYNLDIIGNTRGADGIWDIGAYEFGGTIPPIPPAQPDIYDYLIIGETEDVSSSNG